GSMSSHVIDCGHAVIRLEVLEDHAHLTVIAPSMHDENFHQPAESAMAYLEPDSARALVAALSGLAKPGLKSVGKGQH
ncbi:MAG: hypothetical protein RB191_02845, partial [Terriglobia bacterium]|nr:hypothetical protein [Terriglobia bacterium]